MDRLWILAWNSFEDALRRRILYLLVFVGLFVGAYALYETVYMNMAASAGETEMLQSMKSQFVIQVFDIVEFVTVVLAIFLGSVALANELRSRTIVPVLSRPIGRVSFFFAKWLGVVSFLALFLGSGVAAGTSIALYWELEPSSLFYLGIVQMFLGAVVLSALSLGFSSLFHPVAAGGTALLVTLLPAMTAGFSTHPNAVLRMAASAARYLAPAVLEESLLSSGLVMGILQPDYPLYAAVLAENALYAFAAVLAGALVFRHREILVK
jgi:ABC-type transport system involved in multi-copper enzyme maturation permease subunit